MKNEIVFALSLALASTTACKAPEEGGSGETPGTGGARSGGSGGTKASGGSGGGSTASGGSTGSGGSGGASPATGGGGGTATGGSTAGSGGTSSPGTGGAMGGEGGSAPVDVATESSGTLPPPMTGEVGKPGFPEWKYSKAIKMDTTPAGAGITGAVANYPVAVILNATNFDFAQAKAQGEDLRFGKTDGTPIPYSVEHFDAGAKTAAIWVKIDSIKGNDNAQSFNMYWGNPAAGDASDSTKVFASADGVMAVYHLNEDGNNDPGGYKDASDDPINGTGVAMAKGSLVDARIGKGTLLLNAKADFKGQWIKVEEMKAVTGFSATDHPITASIWVFANTYPAQSRIGNYETPFSKGDRSWTIQRDYQGRWESCTKAPSDSCAIGPRAEPKVWVHLAIMQNKSRLSFFLNGKQVASSGSTGTASPHALGIGQQSQYNEKRHWDGIVDEARVFSTEKGADWIKLDFESQKEGSKFLSFGPTMMK